MKIEHVVKNWRSHVQLLSAKSGLKNNWTQKLDHVNRPIQYGTGSKNLLLIRAVFN